MPKYKIIRERKDEKGNVIEREVREYTAEEYLAEILDLLEKIAKKVRA